MIDVNELRRALCAIGIVATIDGHDVIRRESVLDILAQRSVNHTGAPDAWLTLDADPDTGFTGELTFERVNGESIPLYRGRHPG